MELNFVLHRLMLGQRLTTLYSVANTMPSEIPKHGPDSWLHQKEGIKVEIQFLANGFSLNMIPKWMQTSPVLQNIGHNHHYSKKQRVILLSILSRAQSSKPSLCHTASSPIVSLIRKNFFLVRLFNSIKLQCNWTSVNERNLKQSVIES